MDHLGRPGLLHNGQQAGTHLAELALQSSQVGRLHTSAGQLLHLLEEFAAAPFRSSNTRERMSSHIPSNGSLALRRQERISARRSGSWPMVENTLTRPASSSISSAAPEPVQEQTLLDQRGLVIPWCETQEYLAANAITEGNLRTGHTWFSFPTRAGCQGGTRRAFASSWRTSQNHCLRSIPMRELHTRSSESVASGIIVLVAKRSFAPGQAQNEW